MFSTIVTCNLVVHQILQLIYVLAWIFTLCVLKVMLKRCISVCVGTAKFFVFWSHELILRLFFNKNNSKINWHFLIKKIKMFLFGYFSLTFVINVLIKVCGKRGPPSCRGWTTPIFVGCNTPKFEHFFWGTSSP